MRTNLRTIFQYRAGKADQVGPILDLGAPPELLGIGHCWKLTGVDGRFADTFRRFPGFTRLNPTIHTDGNSRNSVIDLSAQGTIRFFKFAAIQKGDTDYVLRGFVLQGSGAPTRAVIFFHYDTQDQRWYTISLGTFSTTVDIDVAVAARNLILSVQGVSTTTWQWTYNRKDNGGGTASTVLTTGTLSGVASGPGSGPTSDVSPEGASTDNNGYLGGTVATTYRFMFRWYDPIRNLWTKRSVSNQTTLAGGSSTRAVKFTIGKAAVASRVAAGFTKLYCYRTIAGPGGAFGLEQIVNFNPDKYHAGADADSISDLMIGTEFATGVTSYRVYMGGAASAHQPAGTSTPIWSLGLNDTALTLQRAYDPLFDEEGSTPASGLMTAYGDMLISRGDTSVSNVGDTSATLRWSSLYANTPENFPESDHVYRPSVLGHRILSLREAGDYAYSIREDVVTRLHRNGNFLALNDLYRKVGGVSRYGDTSVGQSLYVVTPIGLMAIDGTSGRQDMVAAVERLIIDSTHYWRKTLGFVHLAFDGELGAMAMLNTATEEVYWLWFQNGVVTSLSDVPFTFVTEGPHPETGGADRSWWVTTDGRIFHVNFDRSAPRQTLCGAVGSDTVNGTASPDAGLEKTRFKLKNYLGAAVEPPANAAGFYVYFLSGNNRGTKRKVSLVTVDSGVKHLLFDTPLTQNMVEGDIVAIAPVAYDLGFWSIRDDEAPDLFARSTIHQMAARVRTNAGESNSAMNPALKLTYKVYREPFGRPREADVTLRLDPGYMYASVQETGYSLMPGVSCLTADLDFELHGLQVHGTLDETEADGTA